MSAVLSTIRIPNLRGRDNWLSWALRIKALLLAEGLLDYIKPEPAILEIPTYLSEAEQNAFEDNMKRCKGRVLGIIFCHMEDLMFHEFMWDTERMDRIQPNAVWKDLADKYAPSYART